MASDRGKLLFEEMTGKIIEALGIRTERQRLDSTHITSNFRRLTRLGLFCETARVFLKELRKESKRKYGSIPEGLRRRYLRDHGEPSCYHDAKSSEAKRRIGVSARDVWRLVDRFKGDQRVEALHSYGLLTRLLEEQCRNVRPAARGSDLPGELVEEAPTPRPDDADADDPPAPVVVKPAKEVRSDSLQTPHDTSATYSGRKGKGHEVQLAETCGNGEKPEMITYAEQTRSCDSDEKATVSAVEDLAERRVQPQELLTDTNYGSTENVIECEKRGTELVAPVPGPKVDEAKEGEITKAEFEIDPKGERQARCPTGREAVCEKRDAGTGRVRAFFDGEGCEGCPHRGRCPAKPLRDGRRVLRTTVHAAVLAGRRRYERTKEFRERYAMRAGIEATASELKRAHGLGQLRIRGVLRVRLAVYLKALACNVKRMVRYVADKAWKAERAAAATAEGAGAAASCVILHLHLLRPRKVARVAIFARRALIAPGWEFAFRAAA